MYEEITDRLVRGDPTIDLRSFLLAVLAEHLPFDPYVKQQVLSATGPVDIQPDPRHQNELEWAERYLAYLHRQDDRDWEMIYKLEKNRLLSQARHRPPAIPGDSSITDDDRQVSIRNLLRQLHLWDVSSFGLLGLRDKALVVLAGAEMRLIPLEDAVDKNYTTLDSFKEYKLDRAAQAIKELKSRLNGASEMVKLATTLIRQLFESLPPE